MGWFDQDTKQEPGTSPAGARPQPQTPPPPGSSSTAGSTIGQRVQINGTVISDENLDIVGAVEGTINARKGLRVAGKARVQAVINGAQVFIEGTVIGDVNASETLVLGETASLTGNITTPSLQIRAGAFFKGQVTMQPAAREADAPKPAKPDAAPVRPADARPAPTSKAAKPAEEADGAARRGPGLPMGQSDEVPKAAKS